MNSCKVRQYLPRRSTETKLQVTIVFLLLLSSFLSACGPGQIFGPTPEPTLTRTPMPTPSPPSAYNPIIMKCDDWAMINNGEYQARNNTWGRGDLTDWSQCIGLGNNADGTIKGRWTWDWPDGGAAFPSILFGQVPPAQSTTASLPIKITDIDSATVIYNISSTHTGMGNVTLDIWLTDTQQPKRWGVPPLTHEIMIWLDAYGGMNPAGTLIDQVSIDGRSYKVYVAEDFILGWRYIAFFSETPQLVARRLNLINFLSYLRENDLVTGEEYLAAIEIGNEIIGGGTGETIVNRYVVSVQK